MDNRDELELIVAIAKRAGEKGILAFDRTSLIMDLECAHEEFKLKLDDLLHADEYNFAHDIVGIQNNLDRQELKMKNFFLPRYATQ